MSSILAPDTAISFNQLVRYLIHVCVALSFFTISSHADESTDVFDGDFSHSLTLASDYVFRAESETNDGDIIAAQFSTTFTNKQNWYAGLFISTNKFESAPKVKKVVAPYLGKKTQFSPLNINLNVFIFHYSYPDDSPLNYTELWIKADKDYGPLNLGIEITPTLNDWFGVNGWRGINYAMHPSYPLTKHIKLSGSIGYQALSGTGAQGWRHWNVGVNYSYKNVVLDLRYHDSSIDRNHRVYGSESGVRIFNSRVVIGATINF